MKKIYNEDYYMYRLCNIKGIGRASVRKLVDFFGSAYNVSKADINILKKTGILNGRQIDEFAFSMKNKDNIYKYEDMIKNGCICCMRTWGCVMHGRSGWARIA